MTLMCSVGDRLAVVWRGASCVGFARRGYQSGQLASTSPKRQRSTVADLAAAAMSWPDLPLRDATVSPCASGRSIPNGDDAKPDGNDASGDNRSNRRMPLLCKALPLQRRWPRQYYLKFRSGRDEFSVDLASVALRNVEDFSRPDHSPSMSAVSTAMVAAKTDPDIDGRCDVIARRISVVAWHRFICGRGGITVASRVRRSDDAACKARRKRENAE
jgi:hypothetical protein